MEIAAAGGAYTRGALIKVSWKLVTCTFLLSIWGKIDGDIWSPFLFSRVHCCDWHGTGGPLIDGKYNVTDPADVAAYGADPAKVGEWGIPACEVPEMDRDDPLWSHSLYCQNNAYVLDKTQEIKTAYSVLNVLGTILFLPAGGHIGDSWGRKKVIFWTGFVSVAITMCYWLDTQDVDPPGDMHGMKWFILAAAFHMMHAPSGPAAQAMMIDLVHPDRLPSCLPILSMIGQAGPIIGNVIGVAVVATHLDDYSALWLGMSALGVLVNLFIWWGLVETLPEKDRKPPEPIVWFREYFRCFLLLKTDYVSMQIWWFVFFLCIGAGAWQAIIYNFMVGYLNMTTEEVRSTSFLSIIGTLPLKSLMHIRSGATGAHSGNCKPVYKCCGFDGGRLDAAKSRRVGRPRRWNDAWNCRVLCQGVRRQSWDLFDVSATQFTVVGSAHKTR